MMPKIKHNQELHVLFSSPNTICLVKFGKTGWEVMWPVACVCVCVCVCERQKKNNPNFMCGNLKGREYLENIGIGEDITLKLILNGF
jgi:hypothetical protein